MPESAFASFFLGGFECSSHRRADGRRLDMLESTGHARWAAEDYATSALRGLRTVRDGIRWHLVEDRPGHYNYASWLPQLRAAARCRTQVIWDLCHYGWPDHLDVWSAAFVEHFQRYARAIAEVITAETQAPGWYCPINEISFLAWAGGDMGHMNPFETQRGDELKRQLTRAYIAAVDAIRSVDKHARFIVSEPLIHVAGHRDQPDTVRAAEAYRLAQFQAHDFLIGRAAPELGGHLRYLDMIGVNFYPHNQWYLGGSTIPMGHHAYQPLRAMLAEVFARYERPIFISETGSEGCARPYWFHHVCAEVGHALQDGTPVQGICLYPVTDYPGWDDDRICDVGLFSTPGPGGTRAIHRPLLEELRRQQQILGSIVKVAATGRCTG